MLVNKLNRIYVGTDEVAKAYKGTNLFYERKSTPYTPLSYIESTGLQRINTGYAPTRNTTVVIDMQLTQLSNSSGGNNIFACVWSTNGFVLIDVFTNGNNVYRWHNGAWVNSDTIRPSLDRVIIEVYQGVVKVNGEYAINTTMSSPGSNQPIKLFGFDNFYRGYYKLYGFKIYENDVLVRDFIPVLDTNNIPCLYEKQTEQYFYNVGSGTFLYG